MQTILGANGTIGKPLAKELKKYTDAIRLVSRDPKKVNETDELFPADLSKAEELERAVAGSEVVYLLVGFEYNIKVWRKKWPALMREVIDACKKHGSKLVFFDNIYMYGIESLPHMTEDAVINPPSEKGKVRKQIADMLLNETKQGGLQALIARSADFYGPGNERSVLIETVYKNLAKGKKANWFGSTEKIHSFTYTPDAARATALLGNTASAYNQVWHVPTSGERLSSGEIISIFAEEMGAQNKTMIVPVWMIKLMGLFVPVMREFPEMNYQYENDYFFDSSKFEKAFGIKATSYREGIRETVRSFRE